jgi:hypothetical protein
MFVPQSFLGLLLCWNFVQCCIMCMLVSFVNRFSDNLLQAVEQVYPCITEFLSHHDSA